MLPSTRALPFSTCASNVHNEVSAEASSLVTVMAADRQPLAWTLSFLALSSAYGLITA